MVLNKETTSNVLEVMNRYVRYYNERNAEKVLELFSKTVTGFGTGKNEAVTNFSRFRELIRADLDPSNAIRLDVKILATGGEMPVAWITGLCTMEGSIGQKPVHLDARMTMVLVNRGDRWLFEQIHFSVPGE